MNRDYGDAHYETRFVDNKQEGYAGLELYRTTKGTNGCVARLLFWDASGQFFFETFKTDIPLSIVEELIAEAKTVVKTQ